MATNTCASHCGKLLRALRVRISISFLRPLFIFIQPWTPFSRFPNFCLSPQVDTNRHKSTHRVSALAATRASFGGRQKCDRHKSTQIDTSRHKSTQIDTPSFGPSGRPSVTFGGARSATDTIRHELTQVSIYIVLGEKVSIF